QARFYRGRLRQLFSAFARAASGDTEEPPAFYAGGGRLVAVRQPLQELLGRQLQQSVGLDYESQPGQFHTIRVGRATDDECRGENHVRLAGRGESHPWANSCSRPRRPERVAPYGLDLHGARSAIYNEREQRKQSRLG